MKWLTQLLPAIFRKTGTEGMQTGFVKYFNRNRGFGFIRAEALSKDIFVHVTELEDRVRVGDQVKFQLSRDARGLKARKVRKTEMAD